MRRPSALFYHPFFSPFHFRRASHDQQGVQPVLYVFYRKVTLKLPLFPSRVYTFLDAVALPQRAPAARLLQLVRRHWAIENRLHWRRDVTLREDHSQVRKGTAPRVLAVLNSFLLALLDFLAVPNVPQQIRRFDAQPLLAVRLLLGSLLTFK